jgi:hypothetical protein
MRAKRPVAFEDRALYMARSLVEYHRYGNDPKRAVKLLHAHHPEQERAECERVFGLHTRAYTDAIAFVDANSKVYWDRYNARHQGAPVADFPAEREFLDGHGDVPEDNLETMLLWIFDWHHVR